jgi:nitroreductase
MSSPRQHPILELIHRRASAEEFDGTRGLDRDDVRRLVEDATRAPSAFNIQHWRFVAVTSAEGKERLRRAAFGQEHVARAAVTFIVLGDPAGAERLPQIMAAAVERGAIAEGKAAAWVRMTGEIYADPQVARDEAIRSASLAAMTMMLAAEARGLVACALTGFDPAQVMREFVSEPRLVPVMLIAVGHPAGPAAPRMPRMSLDEVLAFERWPDADRE